jgi:hypothetical protein
MIKNFLTAAAWFIMVLMCMRIIPFPSIPYDLIVGRAYMVPDALFRELPNLVAAIARVLPAFLLLPVILLFAVGLLAITEID